jgi:hypothetical protein
VVTYENVLLAGLIQHLTVLVWNQATSGGADVARQG